MSAKKPVVNYRNEALERLNVKAALETVEPGALELQPFG